MLWLRQGQRLIAHDVPCVTLGCQTNRWFAHLGAGFGARIVAVLTLLLMLPAPVGASGFVDPLFRFRELRTGHFVIYFHQGEEDLARRLASIAEDVREKVGRALDTTPPRRTYVILADQSEIANGWATPLPRNTIFLNTAAPSGAEFIGRTDDWLRLIFTHEYTHIVHLDRAGGWARLTRYLFGRTPVAFPNVWLPQWQVEGLATWQESALAGGGRAQAGDFRALERVAAAAGRVLPLDRVNGGLVAWPDGHAPYAAGLGFHEYLAGRFGSASLGELGARTARHLPYFGSGAFRGVFGQSLGTLWRDYRTYLLTASAEEKNPVGTAARRLTTAGQIVVGPRFAPAACDGCLPEIVYSARTPHDFPSLRSVSVDGGRDRQLTTRYLGSTAAPRESFILFDQHELRRTVALLSDLHVLDRRTGHVRALTHGARLQDPDLSPDGGSVIAVRENRGRRELVRVALRQAGGAASGIEVGAVETVVSERDTQFSTPRWSPDGGMIAVERRRLGALPDLVVIDARTHQVLHTFSDAGARIVTPAWHPGGRAIVAAADFDQQPFELYEFRLGATVARQLTHTNGALWPDISADGSTIAYAGYTADGYDVFTMAYGAPSPESGRELIAPAPLRQAPVSIDQLHARGYLPLRTLAPTSWTPLLLASEEQTRAGASAVGADLLGRHSYAVNLTWLVAGPSVERPSPASVPDWNAAYAYTRWRPTLFASASRETLFREVTDSATSRPSLVGVEQRELQAGLFLPLVHVRQRAQALASVVRTDARYRVPAPARATAIVSSRLAFAYDSTRSYGYSISREHGTNVGTTIELAQRALGSRANATTATLDARVYLPGIGRHHVVALRTAAGSSRGADAARQTFGLGGVAASSSVIDFGSQALGLFRGVTGGSIQGNRVLVANAEYRVPLAIVERGHGTWPLFVRRVHASVFTDMGAVSGGERVDTAWRRTLGAELGVDGVAGYALPFAASLGIAWAHDGHAGRGTTVFARIGRAF